MRSGAAGEARFSTLVLMAREDDLRAFAEEHLWYEIKSAADLTARLARHAKLFDAGLSEADGPLAVELLEPAGRNADIEAWAMHMAILVNFLYGGRKHSDVPAFAYFDQHHDWTGVRPSRPDSLRRLNERVPVEIDHLSLRRSAVKDKRWPYERMWRDLAGVLRIFIDHVPKHRAGEEFVEAVRGCLPVAEPNIDDLTKLRLGTTNAEVGFTTTATIYHGGTATMLTRFDPPPSDTGNHGD